MKISFYEIWLFPWLPFLPLNDISLNIVFPSNPTTTGISPLIFIIRVVLIIAGLAGTSPGIPRTENLPFRLLHVRYA